MTGMVQTDLAHPTASKYKDDPVDDSVSSLCQSLGCKVSLSFFVLFLSCFPLLCFPPHRLVAGGFPGRPSCFDMVLPGETRE